jgi:hypothetical protein
VAGFENAVVDFEMLGARSSFFLSGPPSCEHTENTRWNHMYSLLSRHTSTANGAGLLPPSLIYSSPVERFGEILMVALKTERRVYMWRVRPHCEPPEAEENRKSTSLDEIVGILSEQIHAGTARAYLSSGGRFLEDDDEERDEKNQLYIADLRVRLDDQTVTILVNRGDPNAVATAYLDTAENKVRIDPPKGNEAPGYSAHLVISTVNRKGKNHGKYRACFEKMSRVSSSLVVGLINRILADAVAGDPKYTYTVNVKNKLKVGSRAKPYRPVLGIKKVPSEKLIDDLEKGELAGVTVTKRAVFYKGPGRDGLVKYQEQKITMRTTPADPTIVSKFMRGVEKWAIENDYESVTFHLENLPHGQVSNPTIVFSDEEEALERLYVRAQIISGFKEFLEACYPAICDEIEDKMVAVVNASHGW